MFDIEGLAHRYGDREVLRVPQWRAAPGDHWLLLGDSGSGKTTLLHVLAGILAPSGGEVRLAGQVLGALRGSALDAFRGRHIGLVPQKLHLVASLTALENVQLAQYLAGLPDDRARAEEGLAALGIAALARRRPAELSQGQAQRVAIARAVVNRPQLLLADEPTANLDDGHCEQVAELLESQAAACGATLVIATHDRRLKDRFSRTYRLEAAA
ncbi:MAG: ABC transporter ATP-binding protein [Pseudomonadota bacterium]